MKHLLPLILLLTTLLMGCQHGPAATADTRHRAPDESAASLRSKGDNRPAQQATLSDASNIYRVCSSRPQRLLPSHMAKHERTSGKTAGNGSLHTHSLRQRTFGGRVRTESAPFCFAASRDYYVIALRHILR